MGLRSYLECKGREPNHAYRENTTGMKRYALIPAMLLFFAVAATPAFRMSAADSYGSEIDTLKKHLATKGYDVESLFGDSKFEIYEDIDSKFKNSAENEGIRPVLKAEKEKGKEAAEEVFKNELDKYKIRVGYARKQRYFPEFLERYGETLAAAEKEYGVPKEVTAAVIGLESLFGKTTGGHYAFNVYVSMYVKNYRRTFALSQLEELLAFTKRKEMDVFAVKSSYAGAVGAMQFLPWSLNRYFVGADVSSMDDCINSVANYLAYFKKKRGSIEKAVLSYNPSRLYVQTVLDLAAWAKDLSPAMDAQAAEPLLSK